MPKRTQIPRGLFYRILKLALRLALRVYCGKTYCRGSAYLQEGPLLIAANHPNAFMDALLIGVRCRRRIFILVRGDVFRQPWAAWILRRFYCLPIYRQSDGREKMTLNTTTFSECLDIFRRGENVLIFAEGNCENEWRLRRLRKGAARLAFTAWEEPRVGEALKVVPVAVNYAAFCAMGFPAFVEAAAPITRPAGDEDFTAKVNRLTATLEERLREKVWEVARDQRRFYHEQLKMALAGQKTDDDVISEVSAALSAPRRTARGFLISGEPPAGMVNRIQWYLLLPLRSLSWLAHAPLYYPLKALSGRLTAGTVYYDSVLFGSLFLLYPVYLLLVTWLLAALTGLGWIALCFPALAFFSPRHHL